VTVIRQERKEAQSFGNEKHAWDAPTCWCAAPAAAAAAAAGSNAAPSVPLSSFRSASAAISTAFEAIMTYCTVGHLRNAAVFMHQATWCCLRVQVPLHTASDCGVQQLTCCKGHAGGCMARPAALGCLSTRRQQQLGGCCSQHCTSCYPLPHANRHRDGAASVRYFWTTAASSQDKQGHPDQSQCWN
jgi:hypothetical protein